MDEALSAVSRLLSEVILPNLQVVHAGQTEQIEANRRLELAINELRERLESQFSELSAQLMAYRAELAATHAMIQAVAAAKGAMVQDPTTLIH